jgi:L-asparaginase
LVEKYKIVKLASQNAKSQASILIIYTGGTFGMVYDDDGHLIPFDFERVMDKIPVLSKLGLSITIYSFVQPVDSSNMTITDWQDISKAIYENYDQFDGFVVLHGTDTMAYSASAVSFMLENISKPVIFTGAQIPIGATRSDARENLIAALEIASRKSAGRPIVQEVCIYFNYKLLRGNRAQKIRSSVFGAFGSENYPILAEAGVDISFNEVAIAQPQPAELRFLPDMDPNIAILSLYPGMPDQLVDAVLDMKGIKGLVLESFGSGNVMTHGYLLERLTDAIQSGVVVLNVSQCPGGRVTQGRYETSKQLDSIGVISGNDITTEAAIIKMMHLLANETLLTAIKAKLSTSMRGEMTPS